MDIWPITVFTIATAAVTSFWLLAGMSGVSARTEPGHYVPGMFD